MKHYLKLLSVSPDEARPWVCILCGTRMGSNAAHDYGECENPRGLTEEEALLEGITGKRAKRNDA